MPRPVRSCRRSIRAGTRPARWRRSSGPTSATRPVRRPSCSATSTRAASASRQSAASSNGTTPRSPRSARATNARSASAWRSSRRKGSCSAPVAPTLLDAAHAGVMAWATARLDHGALERIDQVSARKVLGFRAPPDRHSPQHVQLAKQFPAPVAEAHVAAAQLDETVGSEPQGQPRKLGSIEQVAAAVDGQQGVAMQLGLRFEYGLNAALTADRPAVAVDLQAADSPLGSQAMQYLRHHVGDAAYG